MLKRTYEKIERIFLSGKGYAKTAALKQAGISSAQIRELLETKDIVKVTHGLYRLSEKHRERQKNAKMIDVCQANENALICLDSACYFHGLLADEPKVLSVATKKTDRTKFAFDFPVSRHYFSDQNMDADAISVQTKDGAIRVTSAERSVCDMIRFSKVMGKDRVDEALKAYLKENNRNTERLYTYADVLRCKSALHKKIEQI